MRRVHPRLRPWHAWVLTVISSVIGGALATAAGLRARGRKDLAWRFAVVGCGVGLLSVVALGALKLAWYKVAAIFFAVNVLAGFVFAWTLRRWPVPLEPASTGPRGTGWSILWGILGGSLIASYVGGGVGVVYFLGTDVLFSTLFPSISGRFATLVEFTSVLFDFSLLGAVAGGILGAKRPNFTLPQLSWATGGLVFTYYLSRYFGDLLIGIPAFQAQKLAEAQWTALLVTQLIVWVVRCGASVVGALLLADQATERSPARWRAVGVVAGAQLAAVCSIVLYTGRVSYDFLLAGQLLEKNARLAEAQRFYEIGLSQRPDEASSSYLQFRIGLLHRKLGRNQESRTAMSKVVTKYTKSEMLVARAYRFLAAMEQAPQDASRYAIQNVETMTEFKSAYCAPNSLSLVLKFWKVPISAKAIGRQITALDFGTSLPDAFWYVQTKGLRHWVLPLAGVGDVKRFLDQRIPLLLYIPRHVLAVFGYDDALKSFVTYDVAQEDIWIDRPVDELLPAWKEELSTIGVVLPPERFAQLPAEERQRLNRFTSAYFHHAMHYPYHQSSEPSDRDLALAHLEAAVAQAPEFFFDLAHIYVRDSWSHRRAALAAQYDLRAIAQRGLLFVRHQFEDEEVLSELALLLVDLEAYQPLYEFLVQRFKEGALKDHEKLVQILGLLEYHRGNPDAAIAYLTILKDEERTPMVLARAYEATGAWQSALNEYARVLEPAEDDGDLSDLVGRWSDLVRTVLPEMGQDRKELPLVVRRRAMRRVIALSAQLQDQEQLRVIAGNYVKSFPWDAEAQLIYAETLVATLERETDLPADTREQLRRDLSRALNFLYALNLEGQQRERIQRVEAFLKPG